jgi:PAS domain S-box-containing protein
MRKLLSVIFRYGLALGSFILILLISFGVQKFFLFRLDLTTLIIAAMIGSAWYLGRGPGLLVAFAFEFALYLFSPTPYTGRSAVLTFNRLVLFGSLVLFASSRRDVEKKLREQREWLQVTLNSIGDAVIATDIQGRINFINPVAEAITGWKMSEAAGRPLGEVFQIVSEETREPVESPFALVEREGIIVGLANHTLLLARDGTEIPIEDSGAPIKDAGGKMIGVIVVFHDVSERRRAEQEREKLLERERAARSEAEAANRLKDEFLATVSHELRTPLTAILGWAGMLRRGDLEEDTTVNALEVIERNARAQAEIIDDILDVSRIITGKFHVDAQPLELAPIIEAAVNTLRPAAAAKSITLNFSPDETGGLVSGDHDRLQQIIWNLVSNAIKFTPPGGQIEIRQERTDSEMEITVSDNGIGIEEHFLPHVFERFRQADSSSTRQHGGLGLGLAIVRHLVELHGGTVRAESAGDGRGAVFTVCLPIASAHDAAALPQGDSATALNQAAETGDNSAHATDLTGLRVLVVDDDSDTREMISKMLNQYGAKVCTASSSVEALEAFHEWQPNVLVSDLGMPGEDGFTLIGKVRTLTPEQGGNIPAAALTAYIRDEDRQQALAAGYQTHISKPVDPTTLARAVAGLAKRTEKKLPQRRGDAERR